MADKNFARDWDCDDIDPTKTLTTIIQENIVEAFDSQFEDVDGAIICFTPAGIRITVFEQKTYFIPWEYDKIMISGSYPFEGLKSSIPRTRIAMENLFNKEIAEAKEDGEYDDDDTDDEEQDNTYEPEPFV